MSAPEIFDLTGIDKLIEKLKNHETRDLAIEIRKSQIQMLQIVAKTTQQQADMIEMMKKQSSQIGRLTQLLKQQFGEIGLT
jgi:hypothetical protein